MNVKTASTIIESLKPKLISRNNKGEFSQVGKAYLGLGARTTMETRIPGRFELEGWFRFFDKEDVGPRTHVKPGLTAASDDEFRQLVLRHAVSEILVGPHEELAYSKAVLPFNLYILSARASFLKLIHKIIAEDEDEDEVYGGTLPTLKECLGWMRSVHLCLVPEAFVRSIYDTESSSREFPDRPIRRFKGS
jgi:hypothetical protein